MDIAERRRRNVFKGGLLAALLITTAFVAWNRLSDGDRTKKPVTKEGLVYAGIPARVEFVPTPSASGPEQAWRILVDTGNVFNAFDPASELGRLNATPGADAVDVSRDLGDAIGGAIGISQATQGAFDITVRPLKKLWKKAVETGIAPTDYELSAALEKIGWGYLSLIRAPSNSWKVSRGRPGMELDLGGIVKGWSVDRAVQWLTDRRVKSALVQVGGEIGLVGQSDTNRPWRIGIRHPLDGNRNWTVLSITGRAAVSTSGNYEQPIKIGGIDYYHIFDPAIGRPISTDILGVTVVVTAGQDMNARADGLATAFAVMGVDKALETAATMKGVDVLFIVRDKDGGKPVERTTPGFKRFRKGS